MREIVRTVEITNNSPGRVFNYVVPENAPFEESVCLSICVTCGSDKLLQDLTDASWMRDIYNACFVTADCQEGGKTAGL